MAENQEKDKTEAATAYKLEQARKKGQVAKSMELNGIVSLATFTLIVLALYEGISQDITKELKYYLVSSGSINITENATMDLFMRSSIEIITLLSPILVALIITGVIVTMIQTKPVFTTEPIKPKFNKLNPVDGFKRIFSIKTLFELIKTLLKLTVIGMLIYFGIDLLMPDLLASLQISPHKLNEYWFSVFIFTAFSFLIALLPFALLDLLFTKKEYAKKMRMSKRDIKDEVKKRDGDPEIKKKRKQIQNELLKRTSSISNVKDSDVILTNPTHFVVALKYRPHKMVAPIVVAKGSNLLAEKVKKVALSHNIPIMRQPKLTRKIFKETEIGQPILEESYAEVAPIFKWVFDLKGIRY